METKSRYEVIAELEANKRNLIRERDGLADQLLAKEKQIKERERQKEDYNRAWDRQIEDLNEDIKNFKATLEEKKQTVNDLIKGLDESLNRLGKFTKE